MIGVIVSNELANLARELGVTDVCLSVDFADPATLMRERLWIDSAAARHNVCFSSERARDYACLSIQQANQCKVNLKQSLQLGVHHWRFNHGEHGSAVQSRLLAEWGYQHKISASVALSNCPHVFARFVFLIEHHTVTDFDKRYAAKKGKLIRLATELNVKHRLSHYLFADYGLLKIKTIDILSLLSQGDSREQIAEKMHVSVRGVDYHVDMAKLLLKSTTIPALISKASSYGMLVD